MSAIDTQNAKQIRDPMDVLIRMTIRQYINMTYSGYSSSAKIADGILDTAWKMRKLADLQGDGFALDGTAVLYDSSVTPSYSAGKIGVRGNVGQTVSVTASSANVITALSLTVSGAASVTYNGTTSAIVGGQAIIPIGATTVTLTFAPIDSTHRVEVDLASPGIYLRATNDNLIRATVSLRSDLSLYGQTLPESELNVEIYNDADITEQVANIPRDRIIYYSAGYSGDMSSDREFYVSGQVTWKDNVLSIHAVDAVHFLDDVEMTAPVTESDSEFFFNAIRYFLDEAGIDYFGYWNTDWWGNDARWIIPKGTKARDFLAFMNQCFNLTDDNGNFLYGTGTLNAPLQFSYVDAGWPTLRSYKSGNRRHIYEEDCADVAKTQERPVRKVTTTWNKITNPSFPSGDEYATKIGTATFTKGVGTNLQFDEMAYDWTIGLYLGPTSNNDVAQKFFAKYGVVYGWWHVFPVVPVDTFGDNVLDLLPFIRNPEVGDKLICGGIPQEGYKTEGETSSFYTFSMFVPWYTPYYNWEYDGNPSHVITSAYQMWNILTDVGVIESGANVIDLDIYGLAVGIDTQQIEYFGPSPSIGINLDVGEAPIIGEINARVVSDSNVPIYPMRMLQTPMYRSTTTGSFKWKGDPRMQPRDVIKFHRLDGTVEEITLENITITHEGGGTSAEITYRKGVI